MMQLTGCRYAQSIFNEHGPAARSIGSLSWAMTILFLVTTLIMGILLGIAFYRRRGTLAEHEPIDADGGQIWIAIGGIAIPLIVLTVLFVVGLSLMSDFPIHGMPGMPNSSQMVRSMKPQILIMGHQWWWEIHYLNDDPSKAFITANELHLPAGIPVNIEVRTADVMHSFWIPALNGKVDLIPGQPNYIRMMASQPGVYRGQCAEFCGDEHALMRLLAVVQKPSDYNAWLAEQLKPGAQPTTQEAKEGEQVFLSGPCSMCHTVRGTTAGGSVAPDLTHIGSRRMIASDVYPNNDAYLEAWITHAQSLKPDSLMPDLPDFTGEQLTDLVAYLRQLK
ncbi:MAG TPA: c-type cytochrome [Terracidiphilus sp.]|nr:c-type cytochrome [Terracidiphilus sp.]